MKKHLTTLLLALMLTAVAAAQGGKFRIEGSFDNKDWDGKHVVLLGYLYQGHFTSTTIKNGKFTIEDSIFVTEPIPMQIFLDDNDSYYSVNLSRQRFYFGPGIIVVEPKTIHLDFGNDARSDFRIGGTPLNDRLQSYYNQVQADTLTPDNPLWQSRLIVSGSIEPKSQKEESEAIKALFYYRAEQTKRDRKRLWDFYHQNEDNNLGAYALIELMEKDPNWVRKDYADSILNTAHPMVESSVRYRLYGLEPNIFPGHSMLDFKGNAISKNAGTGTWSAPAPATLKQLQANRMSIIYFWGYEINNNVRDELIQLRSLLDSIGAKDINFIGVYSSEYELNKLPERLNSAGIDFPVFIDTDHQIATLYNSRERHHAFILVDPDGVILVSTLRSYLDNDTKEALRTFLQ